MAHGALTVRSDQQEQLCGVVLTAGLDDHDHLVVGVLRDVLAVDQHHLVPLVEAGHTQVSLGQDRGQRAVRQGHGLGQGTETKAADRGQTGTKYRGFCRTTGVNSVAMNTKITDRNICLAI